MTVRLPLYVGPGGEMKLLQRFTFGSDSNDVTHVYSSRTESNPPVAITNAKRISAALLPIDGPIIDTLQTTNSHVVVTTNIVEGVTNIEETVVIDSIVTNGTFGVEATFAFDVSEKSKVNPFRHVYHPSHDGLKWDFATATPSGDNIENYVSAVKPELFSVGNRITFTWDGTTGTAWSPEEKLSGALSWRLTGVRHEGPITVKGRFAMKRISSVTLDE